MNDAIEPVIVEKLEWVIGAMAEKVSVDEPLRIRLYINFPGRMSIGFSS